MPRLPETGSRLRAMHRKNIGYILNEWKADWCHSTLLRKSLCWRDKSWLGAEASGIEVPVAAKQPNGIATMQQLTAACRS